MKGYNLKLKPHPIKLKEMMVFFQCRRCNSEWHSMELRNSNSYPKYYNERYDVCDKCIKSEDKVI